ncbi:MAG: helix-turn-helix transcriptional regulator [Eubacteriales bacterium]
MRKFVSERIGMLRSLKNVSAREMSFALGKSPNYINNIENGVIVPSLEVLEEICDFLEITVMEFFQVENNNPMRVKEMITDIMSLDQEQIEIVHSVVKQFKKIK